LTSNPTDARLVHDLYQERELLTVQLENDLSRWAELVVSLMIGITIRWMTPRGLPLRKSGRRITPSGRGVGDGPSHETRGGKALA
jgi:hypothetical protein